MATTEGSLRPAKIYQVDEKGKPKGGLEVPCMFNPFEYTVSKSNNYKEQGANASQLELQKSSPQTLQLSLIFDSYEAGTDISEVTRLLWQLMEPIKELRGDNKAVAPYVAFEWGVFCFVSVITKMTQKFTLFDKNGTPVRAKVDVTFTQFNDVVDYKKLPQNPTSGGTPIERIWSVSGGERLDNIAAEVYGDATKWRTIAEYNHIMNPFSLEPGQRLTIPQV
jgi:hypothetical protein